MRSRIILLALCITAISTLHSFAAEHSGEKTKQLISVLNSADASLYDKARACQQLGETGTAEAVPALAAALHDEKLSAYARSGLENIPDQSAAAALRAAAETLKGNLLIGVVNSFGTLRDEKAVVLLTKLAGQENSGASAEAMFALGRVANKEALVMLGKALHSSSDSTRANAAAGHLLAADMKLSQKRGSEAAELYDAVRKANVPSSYRAAAVRGAIVARGAKGVALLSEQLRSDELMIRNAALLAIREISSDRLAKALNAELNHAPADLQVQLLATLIDCHNKESLRIAAAKAADDNATVRKAALAVLGSIGGAPEARVLLAAIADDTRPDDAAVANESLAKLSGAAVDREVVKALVSTTNAGARVKYIRLLDRRGATRATPELFKLATDSDLKVSVAALNALRSLAPAAEMRKLISLNAPAKNHAVREAVENAIVGVATRTTHETQAGEAALNEFRRANEDALKISWIRVLVALGHTNALPEILSAARGANAVVGEAALDQLGSWPNPAPADALLQIAKSSTNANSRKTAVASAVKLATTAAEERQRPDDVTVKWFQQANALAQTTEERRAVLSGLGRVKHIESFRMLAPVLDDQTLQDEAAAAVVQIANAVAPADPVGVIAALEKIAANSSNENLRAQAKKLATSIKAKAGTR